MLRVISLGLLIPVAAGCAAMASDSGQNAMLAERDAVRMANWLDGKEPGDAQSCISLFPGTRSTIIGNSTILYRSGGTVYRNDIPGGCPGLDSDRTLVTNSPGSRLCSGEIVRVLDQPTGTEIGSCGLGRFVPYRRRAS